MKHLKRTLLVLLLVLSLSLTSCSSLLPFLLAGGDSDPFLAFGEIEYSRPSVDEFVEQTKEAIEKIENGCSLFRMIRLLNEHSKRYQTYLTMYNYAYIQTSADITDAVYEEEIRFYDENNPLMMEYNERFWIAVAQSKHCSTIKSLTGDSKIEQFKDFSMYSNPEFKELSVKEAKLLTEYRKLLTTAVIEWEGKEQLVNELLDSDRSAEDKTAIYRTFLEKYNPLAAKIFLDLNDVRSRMAKALSFDSYLDIAAYQLGRDFSVKDASAFISGIRENILPLIKEVKNDSEYASPELSELTPDQLIERFDKVIASITPEYTEMADAMKEYGMYDILPSVKKESTSYTTYLFNAGLPFIFLNPTGDESDLMTLVHEFGHFNEMAMTADSIASIDFSECFSQGLETLVLARMEHALDRETAERMRLYELNDFLSVFRYQGMYADFEYRIYSSDKEMTVDLLNEIFRQTSEDWGFDNGSDYFRMTWIEIPHLFLYPTYVLSYTVSLDVALQIYEAELAHEGDGLKIYESLLQQAIRSSEFLEAIENTDGAESPLSEGQTKKTADFLRSLYYGNKDEIISEAA